MDKQNIKSEIISGIEDDNNSTEADSADSSSESEDPTIWTADDEKDFLRTLGALKTHDPTIYENDAKFFSKKDGEIADEGQKKRKTITNRERMTLKDFQRKLIVERGGQLSDDEEEGDDQMEGPSQSWEDNNEKLMEAFKDALCSDESDSEELLKKRVATEEEERKEEQDYYEWLKGSQSSMNVYDKNLQKLKDRWSKDDDLEVDEKFLRDYLLQKKYEEKNGEVDEDRIPTYEEIIEEDMEEDRADQFEQKFNFRFEEPDQEFLKQYPRTVNEALRRSGTKRKEKRSEKMEKKKKRRKIEEVEIPFRYRSVVPNSFGLTTEEILDADDRCLNKWAPISKMSQYRAEDEETKQVHYFERKANNQLKKQKILQKITEESTTQMGTEDVHEAMEGGDTGMNESRAENYKIGDPSMSREIAPKKKKRKSNTAKIIAEIKGTVRRKKSFKQLENGRLSIEDLGRERLKAYGVSVKKMRRAQFSRKMAKNEEGND